MYRQYPGFYSQSDLVAHMAAVTATHGVGASSIASVANIAAQFKQYVISDNLLHSHDAEEQGAGGVYVETKTILINALFPTPSTLRIVFEAKRGASITTNARIYKNGVVYGVTHYPLSTEYVQYSEDLSFASGDTLELWTYDEASAGVWVRNFRVYGNESQVPLGLADPFVGTNS